MILVSVSAPAQPISERWELIARADLIGKARLEVPLSALKASLVAKEYVDLDLHLNLEDTVKGAVPRGPVVVHYYTKPDEFSPTADFLEEHNGKEVIVFLVHSDYREAVGTYFAGYTPDAVCLFDEEEFRSIALEVAQQEEIALRFGVEALPAEGTTPAERRIRRLFDELTVKETQSEAWAELLRTPRQDVPAIVKLMDDERELAKRRADVPTPHSFEATAHYGPPRIVEAASLLLTFLTKTTSFRFVFNGASERERRADVNGWRVWCRYTF